MANWNKEIPSMGFRDMDPMKHRLLFRIATTGKLNGTIRSHSQLSKGEFGTVEQAVITENAQARVMMEELRKLGAAKGMPISQENGQRCYGPPLNWHGPPPPKGTEVFVGKLPRNIYEPDLVPLFEKMGQIYEIRLMMDFSGTNRGYCFVQYTSSEDAQRAIRELDNYEIAKGRKIGVLRSVDNCRLIFRGIPKDKTQSEILQEISSVTEGVRKVTAYPSAQDMTHNRGFVFVEYDSHKTAAMARRKMIPGKVTLFGQDVSVDWAEPEPEVQALFVRNLMLSTSEETLVAIFNEVSSNGVEKVKKIKDFAFIHFTSREQADAARVALDNTDIDGSTVEIIWSKQQDKTSPPKAKSPREQNNVSFRESPPKQFPFSGLHHQDRRNNNRVTPLMEIPNHLPMSVPDIASQLQMFCNFMSPVADTAKLKSSSAIEELAHLCAINGMSEPLYKVATARHGQSIWYNCQQVYISRDGLGQSLPSFTGYHISPDAAKIAAAEDVLPRIRQCFIFNAPNSYDQYVSFTHPIQFAN